MAIRTKVKDTYDYLANQFPTRKARVNRNIGGSLMNAAKAVPGIVSQAGDLLSERLGRTGVPGNLPAEEVKKPANLQTGFPPIGQRIRDYFSKSPGYQQEPIIQPEIPPFDTPPPREAAAQEVVAPQAAPAEEYKPDMNKPFWWLDDRLGEKRPVQLIRGTNVTWQSPVDGKEYATSREAFEGQTTEQRITAETEAAEHQRGMELEALKGQYGIAKAQATPRKRFEIDQDTLSPTDQPNVLDTFEGGIYPGGVPPQGAAQGEEGALNEAQLILSQDEGVGAAALRGMTAAKRKAVLDRMFKMDRAKGLKILDKLSKSATQ